MSVSGKSWFSLKNSQLITSMSLFTWLISGCSQRKAGHERIQADRWGECGHPEVLQNYVVGRNSGFCAYHSCVLRSVPGTHNGQFATELGLLIIFRSGRANKYLSRCRQCWSWPVSPTLPRINSWRSCPEPNCQRLERSWILALIWIWREDWQSMNEFRV